VLGAGKTTRRGKVLAADSIVSLTGYITLKAKPNI